MFQETVKTNTPGTAARLSRGVLGVAFCLFLISAAVNLQAPLYGLYAEAGGYGGGFAAAAFASYVAGLVPILIAMGGISDRVGRKPTLWAALALALMATLAVIAHPTLGAVAASRLLLGVAVGLMSGAGAAFVAEQLPIETPAHFGASIVTASTSLGFGLGPLLTSLWQPHSVEETPVSYLAYLPCALAGALALGFVREPRSTLPQAPWLRLPIIPRGGLAYAVAISTAWAASGAIIAIVPLQLNRIGLAHWAGLIGFLIICPGLLGVWVGRCLAPRDAVCAGLVLAPLGYVMTVLGVLSELAGLVLIGAALAGIACYGLTYLGGLSATLGLAHHEQKARASAGFFLFAYFGFSVPVVLLGFLGDYIGESKALVVSAIVISVASLITLVCITSGVRNRTSDAET